MPMRFAVLTAFLGVWAGALEVGAAATDEPGTQEFTPLFNGKDLTGFRTFLDPKAGDADPTKTWTVEDGVIRCSGKPSGYFYTDKSYSDYVLRYDWRYPAGSPPSSNSGCLVHIHPPHALWPQAVEPQGRYFDHGKLFFIKVKAIEQKFDALAHKQAVKPMGEWNTTEITCDANGTVSVKLNGVPVSSGKTELTEGPIGWQSEGAEIHFRNIELKKRD
jgi:hypothetical protein